MITITVGGDARGKMLMIPRPPGVSLNWMWLSGSPAVLSTSCRTNVGKSLSGGRVLNAVAGGWQVSGIFNAEGGVPFPVTMSGANLSGSLAGTWLPNRIGSGALSNPSIKQWFNPGVFVAPSPYTFGNTGRNVLRGPGFWDLDFGLAKSFRLKFLGEKAFLQVRGDAYDVFDHANFGQPASAIGALGVGVITSATTNRTVQLGARIEF